VRKTTCASAAECDTDPRPLLRSRRSDWVIAAASLQGRHCEKEPHDNERPPCEDHASRDLTHATCSHVARTVVMLLARQTFTTERAALAQCNLTISYVSICVVRIPDQLVYLVRVERGSVVNR
jgi:hypothetical protein